VHPPATNADIAQKLTPFAIFHHSSSMTPRFARTQFPFHGSVSSLTPNESQGVARLSLKTCPAPQQN
jgi:hypothetical protein